MNGSTPSRIAQAAEHEAEAWREVCRVLRSGGVVTEADCMESARGLRESYGQIVLETIREWGKFKQDLGGAREERARGRAQSQLSLI